MEFLDLSDANDDEKAQAMAIIGCCRPITGVEFPFELKTQNDSHLSQSTQSLNSSPQLDFNTDLNQPAIESQFFNSSPNLRLESTHEMVSHTSEPIETSNSLNQWEMSGSGVPVVCAPTQYIYHQTPPSYYPTNAPMPGPYYSPVPNSGPKLRSSVVNSGKSGKPIHTPDIRTPFYSPPHQYSEVPQLIDGSRPPPTAIVSDGMLTLTNGPVGQPMFTPAFPHTFMTHHSPFPAPQVYLIATAEGPILTYGLPSHSVQMPRPSSPPTVPNIVDITDDNSANVCKVPSIDGNGSQSPVDGVDNDMNEDINEEVIETNDNNEDIESKVQSFRQNNESIIESKVNVCPNDGKSLDSNTEPLAVDTKDNETTNNSLHTTSASTPDSNTTTNVWSSANSQRSWADLFKGSSSASIHNSLITSSQTPSALTSGLIVSHNYNDINLSESDSHLNSSVVISESEAQIQCIPMRNDPFARKLSKRVKQIGLKHFLPYLIPSGLVNRGNWCYINATLQALVGCPPFYNLMRELGDISGLFRERSSTPIIDSF